MQYFKTFAIAALFALPAGAALAKDKPADTSKEKKICRVEEDTGSRVARHRTCMTAAEWAREDKVRAREAETAVGSTQDRTGNANPNPFPPHS